jgi:hypothetical protein
MKHSRVRAWEDAPDDAGFDRFHSSEHLPFRKVGERGGIGSQMSVHALRRINQRRIPIFAVQIVIDCGRSTHQKGAVVYAIGRKEVERFKREGINLQPYQGLQVVCGANGKVITVYRNNDFRPMRKSAGQHRGSIFPLASAG